MPIQRLEGDTALLETPLLFGHRLVVGPGATDYAVAYRWLLRTTGEGGKGHRQIDRAATSGAWYVAPHHGSAE